MKLTQEMVTQFLLQQVLLTLDSGFLLEGCIVEVFDDGIMFKTPQKTSLISFEAIKIIVPVDRRDAK
jgi:hypothetical protein